MDRKTIIAVILSILVVIGYQLYVAKFYPAAETTAIQMPVNETRYLPEEKSLVAGVLTELGEALEIAGSPE